MIHFVKRATFIVAIIFGSTGCGAQSSPAPAKPAESPSAIVAAKRVQLQKEREMSEKSVEIQFMVNQRFDTEGDLGVYDGANMSALARSVLKCPPSLFGKNGSVGQSIRVRVFPLGELPVTMTTTNIVTGVETKKQWFFPHYVYVREVYDIDNDLRALPTDIK